MNFTKRIKVMKKLLPAYLDLLLEQVQHILHIDKRALNGTVDCAEEVEGTV
jgi:hypothetical protein